MESNQRELNYLNYIISYSHRVEITIANAKNDCKIAKATYDRLSAILVSEAEEIAEKRLTYYPHLLFFTLTYSYLSSLTLSYANLFSLFLTD